MPRIARNQTLADRTPQETLAEKIKAGKAVPLLSAVVEHDLILGGHEALVKDYVERIAYPLANTNDLPHIAQFRSVTHLSTDVFAMRQEYLDVIKSRLFSLAEDHGVSQDLLAEADAQFDDLDITQLAKFIDYPRFGDIRDNPLLLLASLDLPIYLTTSSHTFLEAALGWAKRKPRTEFCRWHQRLESSQGELAGDYQPTRDEPLVYHLYGLDKYPESLVLTEDDHLEFLVAIARDMSRDTDRIPKRIRQALSDSSLILLGYDLRSWEFRTLFWGLIRFRPPIKQENVSVQVAPDDMEKLYLDKYLSEARFRVVWGDVYQYIRELYHSSIGA
jgi:SIR2-like domain